VRQGSTSNQVRNSVVYEIFAQTIVPHGLVHKHAVIVGVEPEQGKWHNLPHSLQYFDEQGLFADQERRALRPSIAISVSVSVCAKLPAGTGPLCETRSASMKPGGGSSQSEKVRTGMLRRIPAVEADRRRSHAAGDLFR
jgi:hypothetical protein